MARSPSPNPTPQPTAGPATPAETSWHGRTVEEVMRHLETSRDGLHHDEARRRLEKHGPNELPRAKGDTPLKILWRQINNPLIWVLIGSGGVAMAAQPNAEGMKNGLVILGVVILNSIIGFVQEYRAGQAIQALAQMVPELVNVLRSGRQVSLPAPEIVPGDVVLLASGDRVPADLRLIEVKGLQAEEAALTGESVPARKQSNPVAHDAGLGDRLSMGFGGTMITAGTGTGVVVTTGAGTELGRISQMLGQATDLETPLTRALGVIGRWITLGIVAIALVMLGVGVARDMATTGDGLWTALRETVIFAIALAVGAIPEGLPAIVTIALAIGVRRMAKRRAVIRKLPAVETLGSTTVICTDKTGTLTRNEMTVQALWTPDDSAEIRVGGIGYAPEGELSRAADGEDGAEPLGELPEPARELLLAGVLCTDAALVREEGRWTISGDPTEGALLVAARKAGIDPERVKAEHRRLDAIPFESEHQFMATLVERSGGEGEGGGRGRRVLMKGAPEVVVERCEGIDAEAVRDRVHDMARRGMRVLAVAAKETDKGEIDHADAEGGFRLLGLEGMIDPPREEAIEAVRRCHAAGIEVKMITGDHAETAAAIGRQLGLIDREGEDAVTGRRLAEASDEQLRAIAEESSVFARVAPEHKLRLVKALQAERHVVAMTGDGVNDAPALKQSNIGVAMGITGTAVSKESADIVLTDDNFATIAAAVEEGRRVYDNLVKSLAFVLPTNLGLALVLLFAVAFFPFVPETGDLLLPLSPVQLLWINLVAAVALALPLAFELPEPDVMDRPPRAPDAPVLSPFVLMRTGLVALLMTAGAVAVFVLRLGGLGDASPSAERVAEAQTAAVTTIILFQIFYLLHCRSLMGPLLNADIFRNRILFAGIAAVLALQALFIYAPPLQAVFGSAPLEPVSYAISAGVAASILPIISLEKMIRRRWHE